jgi:hypothetical protein
MVCSLVAESSVPPLVISDDEISLEPVDDVVRKAIASFVDETLGSMINPIFIE